MQVLPPDSNPMHELQECIQSKLCQILCESGFGEITIKIERVRVDRVAIVVQSGVYSRFILRTEEIETWLKSKGVA